MDGIINFLKETGFAGFFEAGGWKNLVMIAIACLLCYLAIGKKFEPLLLLPIAIGMLITNLPFAGAYHEELFAAGHIQWDLFGGATIDADKILHIARELNIQAGVDAAGNALYYTDLAVLKDAIATGVVGEFPVLNSLIALEGTSISVGLIDVLYLGVKLGIYPCLIFIGVGAMTDFGPLLSNPKSLILGAAAQIGIFATVAGVMAVSALGEATGWDAIVFTLKEAASIGIIGGADGPTAIYTTSLLAPQLLGPIAVAAYSYMALVPVIQPPIMRLLTTKKERRIRMDALRPVSKKAKILFPIIVTIVVALIVPSAAILVGCLMFGNLLKECGVCERLSKTVQNELMNIVTVFLGISVGATATAATFLSPKTIIIILMGVVAFAVATASGVLIAKLMNLFLPEGKKINPLIGSAGVSAVPMAARVSQKVGQEDDPGNFLLMHAMGPNVAGVIGSGIAAGVLIALLG
ncbi:MAG: sodium ion-translocating decarboxylase subunit beta [Ruminococcaceae bacterium]|nr:sodium ion-translocating decarboxylase subunit beta [Oscillospiraceae bacterium]